MTKHEELERLARAATPGPWMRDRLEPETIRTEAEGDIIVGEVELIKDAAFIAAANPATVLALLSANREMREALEPFAALSEKFGHLTIVEVSKPHPLNPSPIIQPLPVRYLTAARSALSTKETT